MSYSGAVEVADRLPYRSITTSTKPSTGDVDRWGAKASAILDGVLAAAQVAVPVIHTGGVAIVSEWTTDYAEGRYRMALASAGGDGDNDDGKDLIEGFKLLMTEITASPSHFQAMLNGGASSDATRQLRGNVTDNADGKSVSDFEPTFTVDGDNF